MVELHCCDYNDQNESTISNEFSENLCWRQPFTSAMVRNGRVLRRNVCTDSRSVFFTVKPNQINALAGMKRGYCSKWCVGAPRGPSDRSVAQLLTSCTRTVWAAKASEGRIYQPAPAPSFSFPFESLLDSIWFSELYTRAAEEAEHSSCSEICLDTNSKVINSA